MKLTVLQESLAKSIIQAARFASGRVQLPILGNILISATKTRLNIASTNLEISVSSTVGAKIEEVGEISIPAKTLADIISNLPKETVTLIAEGEQLKITSTGFSSKVLGMNASDFPKIPISIAEDSLILPKKELSNALVQVLFATSLDETRPILTGVLFILDGSSLTLVSTDGFRLSKKEIKVQLQSKSQKLIKLVIPKNILNEISKSSEESEEIKMEVRDKEKQVVFGLENVILSSRLLEGDYPDFAKIIPKSSLLTVLVDKVEFERSVKLASVFARESSNIVKIKVLKDSIKVLAESGTSGSQETKVDAKVSAEGNDLSNWEISFNYRFLEEFLHSAQGEEIKMEFTTQDKAGVFTDSSDKNYLHLIMPVKVQG